MAKTALITVIFTILLTNCSVSKKAAKTGFSNTDIRLIMNSDSLTPMRIYKITNKQDSLLLRTPSNPVTFTDNNTVLKHFIKRLYSTVRDSLSMGVGIAAPQVGILKQIIWVQRFDKTNFPFEVYLNPKITHYSTKKQTYKEGCLSIPDRTETLNNRSFAITFEYDTINKEHKTETVDGFTAIIFQHEIDHLNGILYLDHLNKDITETKAVTD